jgi:hypothetical protein
MFLPVLREKLSQGDILTQITLIDSAATTTSPQRYNVIVLSHDCEIDKPNNSIIIVCALRNLSEVPSITQEQIRKNKVYRTMYLESTKLFPESFVDFRLIFRVNKNFLEECSRQGFRVASLNDEARLALPAYFYMYLTRKVPGVEPLQYIRAWLNRTRASIKSLFKNLVTGHFRSQ